MDAAIMCTVGRRASIAQGRALLSIWDRSYRSSVQSKDKESEFEALISFNSILRSAPSASSASTDEIPSASAHLGPLFGAIACVLGISMRQSAYAFLLSHVKALLSAAVRASIFGPYQAQKILASVDVQDNINKAIDREWETKIEEAGQSLPVMDLWMGRHEMLYSRIFNS
jgi:urease accessory protein